MIWNQFIISSYINSMRVIMLRNAFENTRVNAYRIFSANTRRFKDDAQNVFIKIFLYAYTFIILFY